MSCSTLDGASMGSDDAEFSGAMTKWMASWRHMLIGFCLPAMDLPNHPPNRLATHWCVPATMHASVMLTSSDSVFIRLRQNRDPATRAQSFSVSRVYSNCVRNTGLTYTTYAARWHR